MKIGESKGEKMLRICFCDNNTDEKPDLVAELKIKAAEEINKLEGVAHLIKQRETELNREKEDVRIEVYEELKRIQVAQQAILEKSFLVTYALTSEFISNHIKV